MKSNPKADDEGGGYMVPAPDLPGCIADGATIDEAISEAHDVFKVWVMAEQEDKGKLPLPKTYSGQYVQRIPKSLHRQLAKRAENVGASLNQLTETLLAQGLAQH